MRPLCFIAILAAVFCLGAGLAKAAEPFVVCSLDRPVIGRHQVANVTAFTAPPSGTRHYRWHANAGVFATPADGASVAWAPGGAAPGSYRVSVRITGADGTPGGCAVDVLVTETVRSAPAVPGDLGSEAERDLLVRGNQEHEGYGLYSYILLGARPDDGNRDRYKALLEAYLRLEDVNLPMYFPTGELNVAYVPVESAPVQPPDAVWVLDHYDYARARFLLSRLGIRDGDGPFIVSALHPIDGASGPGETIRQDLSTVPASVMPAWMKMFRSQTTQQRVWQQRTIGTTALNLRTLLAVAAEGLPMVLSATDKIITVVKGGP